MGAFEIITPQKPVYTKKSTSTTQFIPLTPVISGQRIGSVRVGIEFRESTGDIEVRPVYQTSDDGITWSATSTLSGYTSYVSTAGFTYGSTYASVTQAPFLRLGAECKNQASTKVDTAMVSLILDIAYS